MVAPHGLRHVGDRLVPRRDEPGPSLVGVADQDHVAAGEDYALVQREGFRGGDRQGGGDPVARPASLAIAHQGVEAVGVALALGDDHAVGGARLEAVEAVQTEAR